MLKNLARLVFVLVVVTAAAACAACSRPLGYSVVLWNYPEGGLRDGDIVKVFIRSNISQVYVIELPGSNDRRELPLWQLSVPQSKGKAAQTADAYRKYQHKYARTKTDGLPLRAEPANTARSLYRLRADEVVKILYEGQGQAVMAGEGVELEGKWLYSLTNDGTQGWCFSYSLDLFETNAQGERIGAVAPSPETEKDDGALDNVLQNIWYPSEFKKLIADRTIDLTVIRPEHKFQIDAETNRVVFKTSEINGNWIYTGFEKPSAAGGNTYKLTDIPIAITLLNDEYIRLRYTAEGAKPQDFEMLKFKTPLEEVVEEENTRRYNLYRKIYAASAEYGSSNYGRLSFAADGRFEWRGYNLLVPDVLAPGSGTKGRASVNYILSQEIAKDYDGVMTLSFDGNRSAANFLFKLEESGLRLEDARGAIFDGQIVTRRSPSPLVLFFSK